MPSRRTPLRARRGLSRRAELRAGAALARSTPLARTGFLRRVAWPQAPSGLMPTPAAVPVRGSGRAKRRWARYTGPPARVRRLVRQRSLGRCEIALPGCRHLADQIHHRLGRKAGGRHGAARTRVNGAAWLLDCCSPCHRQVTSPHGAALAVARGRGLLLREHEDARLVPVLGWRGVPVLLDDAGGWRPAGLATDPPCGIVLP